jgi:hypothetical protein
MISHFLRVHFVSAAQCGRILVAGIACFVFADPSTQAATIVESEPFTIQAPFAANLPVQTVVVATPQFNSSLGTFDTGSTVISGTTSIGLEFFNTGAGGPYDLLLSDTLTLGGIPGLFVQELTGTGPANQPAYIAPAATFSFGPVERSDPSSLVVGSGTWDQLFSLPFPSLTINQGPAAVLPAVIITGSAVTTYAYTPVATAVPEPGFSFMLSLLFACGSLVRNWRMMRVKALRLAALCAKPVLFWPLKGGWEN